MILFFYKRFHILLPTIDAADAIGIIDEFMINTIAKFIVPQWKQ